MVSVLVSAYNQARYLPQALESLLAQDLTPDRFEVIVVDDGSTDDTAAVLRGYAGRMTILTRPHGGLAAACNAGLARARGAYVARVDADDFVHPAWLRRGLELLEAHPEACCVFPGHVEVLEDGSQRLAPVEAGNLYSLLACGTLMRTSAVRAVGGVRPLFWEEYDLYLRLRERGGFLHLTEPLYCYRRHAESLTANAQARRAGWQELLQLWGAERLLAAGSSPELDEVIASVARR